MVITSFTAHGVLPYSKQILYLCQCISLIQLVPVASSLMAVMNMLARTERSHSDTIYFSVEFFLMQQCNAGTLLY